VAPVTRLYSTLWPAKLLTFDGNGGKDLPLFFDVIEAGMSNILLSTSQILARKSTSILYTETFRLAAKEPDDDLYESLFMDVDLASLIIGLAPVYG
jgi:hypothetical protein